MNAKLEVAVLERPTINDLRNRYAEIYGAFKIDDVARLRNVELVGDVLSPRSGVPAELF